MNNISFLIGIVAYAVFLLWNQKKNPSKSQNRLLCFIIGLIFSVFMYYVHLIGVTIGGFLGGFLTTFLPLSNAVSYGLSSICGLLLASFTIKILFSKISDVSFHYFRIISFFIYLVFGLYMLQQSFSSDILELQGKSTVVIFLGLSYIGISIYVAMFSFLPKMLSATSKIDLVKSVDSVPDISTTSTQVSEDAPAVTETADKSISHDETVPTIIVSEPQTQISIPQKKHPHLPRLAVVIILTTACILCVLIGYLAGGGYLSEDFVPNSPYIQKLKKAESDASSKGYKKGYHDGRDDGYTAGKEFGYQEGYNKGYNDGAYDELALLLDDYLG